MLLTSALPLSYPAIGLVEQKPLNQVMHACRKDAILSARVQ